MRRRRRRRQDVGQAALRGAVAGLAGGLAMLLVGELEARAAAGDLGDRARELTQGPRSRSAQRRRRQAAPSKLAPRDLAVQLAAAATVGAVYGVLRSQLPLPQAAHGALLRGLAYAANASGLLPERSILSPPADASAEKALLPAGAHALFGVATTRVFDMLMG